MLGRPAEGLSMNLVGHRIAACRGKAALKTHALQTLTRRPLTRPEREAFGVRPIYRRFPSGAGEPAVHGPQFTNSESSRLSMKRPFVLVVVLVLILDWGRLASM